MLNPGRGKIEPTLEKPMKKSLQKIISHENWLALLLALILIALVIFTADTSPTWIYQGF